MRSTIATVYDHDGNQIDDALTGSFLRSWILNDIGKCSFEIATRDFRESLEIGKLIYLESEVFPAWGGVIDIPRTWNPSGTVNINAYSAAHLLLGRRSTVDLELSGDSGVIFQHLIEMANAQYPTRIDSDDVWHGGNEIIKKLSAQSIYDEIVELAKQTGCDWEIVPEISDSQKLSFRANWYQRKGEERRQIPLMEGFNIEAGSPSMEEQAPVGGFVNDLLGYGNGSIWNEKIKKTFYRHGSISVYGPRQGFARVDTVSPAALEMAVSVALDKGSQMRRTFNISVLDIGDVFSTLGIGNLHELEMYSCGFTRDTKELQFVSIGCRPGGPPLINMRNVSIGNGCIGVKTDVRLIGMEINDSIKKAKIVVDEVS